MMWNYYIAVIRRLNKISNSKVKIWLSHSDCEHSNHHVFSYSRGILWHAAFSNCE